MRAEQVRAVIIFDDIPLFVLTAGIGYRIWSRRNLFMDESWLDTHLEIIKLSTLGSQIIIKDTTRVLW